MALTEAVGSPKKGGDVKDRSGECEEAWRKYKESRPVMVSFTGDSSKEIFKTGFIAGWIARRKGRD